MRKGFTLVEILVVVGTLAVLAGVSASALFTLNKRSDADVEARKLQSVLNRARNQTLASENEQSFGVHIATSTSEYVLFQSAVFNPLDPTNERFVIPANITLGVLALQGGGSDIVFERLTGRTSRFGSVALYDRGDMLNVQTVCVGASGDIEVQVTCPVTALDYIGGVTNADLASFPANFGLGDPAQSFSTGVENIYVRAVELYVRKLTADPSDIYLEVRQASSVGGVLQRSLMVDGASLSTGYGWAAFVFPSPVFLLGNTQYFLRLRSLPDSTIAFSNATGTIYWGYEHAATSPPAYPGGDAWRYVGQNNNPSYEGQRLGPQDQYDFSFRILYGVDPPPQSDSRHLEFDLLDSAGRGWSIRGASTLQLVFHDPPNADVARSISMANFFNSAQTVFDWTGTTTVNGDPETLRVHTHYIDAHDTTLSLHRDRRVNQKAVDISIDGRAIVSYAANGTPTVGAWGGVMVYR
jgi:prepilin-type N-terminal cleavage/methylation domain-containing protein